MAHVIPRQADWSSIPDLLSFSECTPQVDGYDFEGILINTPEVIEVAGEGTLAELGVPFPLAGTCRFRYDRMGLFGSFVDSILLVAVDVRTHVPYAAKIESVENAEPPPDEPVVEDPDLIVGEVFNPDLARLMHLPATDTRYVVYASLGPYQSNVLTTRVRRVKP